MELQHFSHSHPLILNEEQEVINGEGAICSGCEEPISGPQYRCTCCQFFLHKRCAELPLKINHILHHKHPLLLLAKPPSDYPGGCFCDLCRKKCNSFVYHCSPCKFDLHIKCAFPPCFSEGKGKGQHQFIRLIKSIPLKSSSFTCNFCGTDGDESPFLCTLCQVMFHEQCVDASSTIIIRQHPHHLTYTYFPQEVGSEKPRCGICQIQFNIGHGGYNCEDCNFFAHVKCAREYRENRNDESMDSSITCTATAHEVEHFSHEHRLILIEEDKNNVNCAGCVLPLSAPSYGCSTCNFFLHKACVELKLTTSVDLPGIVDVSLFSRAPTIDGVFRCDLCHQYCDGFVYMVGENGMKFDVRCGINFSSSAIAHESHEQHRLFLTERNGRRCNSCGDFLDTECFFFRCASCDFSLDFRCAGLPREAKHRYDEHPLLLAYVDPNDYQYVCQVCEKERDPKLWFYRCEECDFDAHIECVLREYHPYVKLGKTELYDFHPHPLVLVEKMGDLPEEYPKCSNCGEPCDELALECIEPQCNFIVHSGREKNYEGSMISGQDTLFANWAKFYRPQWQRKKLGGIPDLCPRYSVQCGQKLGGIPDLCPRYSVQCGQKLRGLNDLDN